MYYILLKNFNSIGYVVYGSNDSKELNMIDNLLNYKLDSKNKQVVLLSNLEMWKYYQYFISTCIIVVVRKPTIILQLSFLFLLTSRSFPKPQGKPVYSKYKKAENTL